MEPAGNPAVLGSGGVHVSAVLGSRTGSGPVQPQAQVVAGVNAGLVTVPSAMLARGNVSTGAEVVDGVCGPALCTKTENGHPREL